MTDVLVRWIVWSSVALSGLCAVALLVLVVVGGGGAEGAVLAAGLLIYPLSGALIASRRPRQPVGWLLCAVGPAAGITLLAGSYAELDPPRAGAMWAAWTSSWIWIGALGPVIGLLLLFPDGRLLSRRWRPLAGVVVAGLLVTAVGSALTPGLLEGQRHPNPVGVEAFRDEALADGGVGWLLMLAGIVGAVVSMVLRYRRAGGDERAQLRWLAYVAGVLGMGWLGIAIFWDRPGLLSLVPTVLFVGGMLLLPVAVGFAVLKHRLYDIDVVISRTLAFGGLAGFITVVYVAIVVGVGSLFGAGGQRDLTLSIVATAVVAVAFQPVRERVTRLADRLVYGTRASPYEVLSRSAEHLSEAVDQDTVLERMARLLADGTGATAAVWVRVGEQLRPVAVSPADAVPDLPTTDLSVDVVHHGEVLGALSVTKRRGEPLTPIERRLVEDLAGQAGLVLRNARLAAELRQRLEDLHRSARRLVEAQDTERRRLERDLHDGAQQQLVALKLKLGLARTLADREAAAATGRLLDALAADADTAVQTLRELAHGIYPPLLAAEGLPSAVASQAARLPVPATVDADGLGRYPAEVEAAVYFCVLEALQNTAKYADATGVTVTLREADGKLAFTVQDDGAGFDPTAAGAGQGLTNMRDRIDALRGGLRVRSSPGVGTTVEGTIPVDASWSSLPAGSAGSGC